MKERRIIFFVALASVVLSGLLMAQDHGHTHEHEAAGESIVPTIVGRVHPLLVHFPVALLIAAALVEAWRMIRRQDFYSAGVPAFLRLGTAGAVAAVLTGLRLAAEHGMVSDIALLERHRFFGITTAVLILLSLTLGEISKRKSSASIGLFYRIVLFASAISVAITGKFGGDLSYGEDFFFGFK